VSKLGKALKSKWRDDPGPQILFGTFQNAETDANLSSILIQGAAVRWVRKLEHVTGLTTGDAILLLQDKKSLTIIGVVVGDITNTT